MLPLDCNMTGTETIEDKAAEQNEPDSETVHMPVPWLVQNANAFAF